MPETGSIRPMKDEPAIELAARQLEHFAENTAKPGSQTYISMNAYYGGAWNGGLKSYAHQCHAYIRSVPMTATVVYSHLPELPASYGAHGLEKEYYQWITGKDSPWRRAMELGMSFKDKKFFSEEFWLKNGLIFDTLDRVPANLMQNMLIGSRVAKEHHRTLKVWKKFVDKGISKELALLGVSVFHGDINNNRTCLSSGRGDWPLDPGSYQDDYIKNFMNHTPDEKNFLHTYNKSHNYTPCNAIWGTIAPIDEKSRVRHGWCRTLREEYSGKFGTMSDNRMDFDFTRNPHSAEPAWKVNGQEFTEILRLEEKRLRS